VRKPITRPILAAIIALSPAVAFAQQAAPQSLLPGQQAAAPAPAVKPAPQTGVDAAFQDTEFTSVPVVQDMSPPVIEWPVDTASQLVFALETSDREGLEPKDYEIAALRKAILAGAGPELDAIASRNFVMLVEDLRDGRTPMEARKQWFVEDPDADLYRTKDLLDQLAQTGDLAQIIDEIRPTHPDYMRLLEELAATPEKDMAKRKLIRANLDRWRWLPRDLGKQYLITNVPEYQLRLTVNDKIISTYRTIVGKPGKTATPQLAEKVEGVVFNPTWTVPQSIVKGEGLGARVLGNPAWAKANGYKGWKDEKTGFVTVVQQPGPGNSLGLMKLDMPNPHAIFLHDTPARNLFANDKRALSHGCIRTERALELAITMAIVGKGATKDEAIAISSSREYTKVALKKEFPVYITYFTMASDIDGSMRSYADIYDRDAPVLASFDQPRMSNRARTSSEEVVEIVDDLKT